MCAASSYGTANSSLCRSSGSSPSIHPAAAPESHPLFSSTSSAFAPDHVSTVRRTKATTRCTHSSKTAATAKPAQRTSTQATRKSSTVSISHSRGRHKQNKQRDTKIRVPSLWRCRCFMPSCSPWLRRSPCPGQCHIKLCHALPLQRAAISPWRVLRLPKRRKKRPPAGSRRYLCRRM